MPSSSTKCWRIVAMFYILYAYTRICSISNSGEDFSNLAKVMQTGFTLSLEHEKKWKYGKQLLKFHVILMKIARNLLLHNLCEYC